MTTLVEIADALVRVKADILAIERALLSQGKPMASNFDDPEARFFKDLRKFIAAPKPSINGDFS